MVSRKMLLTFFFGGTFFMSRRCATWNRSFADDEDSVGRRTTGLRRNLNRMVRFVPERSGNGRARVRQLATGKPPCLFRGVTALDPDSLRKKDSLTRER